MAEYYRQVELVEGTLVQVIGVHPVMWRDVISGYKDQADYGFVEAPEVADLIAALEAVEAHYLAFITDEDAALVRAALAKARA